MLWRHGDVLIAAVEALPAGAKRRPSPILVWGEVTGHSHRVADPDLAEVWDAGGTLYLYVRGARRLILAREAPAGVRVSGHLNLSGQAALTALPEGLCVTRLDLSNCPNLPTLPAGLRVQRLNVSGCTGLRELPAGLRCYELQA